MAVCWQLYRFDYVRFVQMRPALRVATTPAAFAALADTSETEAIVEAIIEGEVEVPIARQAFLLANCCLGEAISFHQSFPRLITTLRRDRRAESGMELLSDALAGGKNIESWLLPAVELIGFLTPQETRILCEAYHLLRGKTRRTGLQKQRRPRRGGLVGGIGAFFRRLFDRELPPEEVFLLLGEMLDEAVEGEEGIAVVAA